MAYLKGFGLENFRVFKDYTWFDFAPITILVGPNSSGKSSLIKALLLLKDNYERHKLVSDTLKFDGLFHNLSSGKSVVTQGSTKESFAFEIQYNLPLLSQQARMRFAYRNIANETKLTAQDELVLADSRVIHSNRGGGHTYFDLPLFAEFIYRGPYIQESNEFISNLRSDDYIYINRSHIDEDGETEDILFKKFYGKENLKTINSKFTKYEDFSTDMIRHDNQESLSRISDMLTNLQLDTYVKEYEDLAQDFEDFRLIIGSISALLKENNLFSDELAIKLGDTIEKFLKIDNKNKESMLSAFNSIIYLPSVKGQTRRWYGSGEEEILNRLIKDYFKNKITDPPYHKAPMFANNFVSKWADRFGLKEFEISREDKFDLNFTQANNLSFADQGYGLSQIAALLLTIHKAICTADPTAYDDLGLNNASGGIIVLLEEPESNLHPKFQSMLADMLVEAATIIKGNELGVQFIIETHSEYLIRKLQFLTAKGDELMPNDTAIYYFHDPNNVPAGEKQVKKINILEDGSLSDDFGAGFFDEAATWELELLKLKRSKSRQN